MEISFGAKKSKRDYRTVTTDQLRTMAYPLPNEGKVNLNRDYTNQLSDQMKIGVCTACAVRMAAEEQFNDAVRLSEFWLYLMGKVLVDGDLNEGSSAFTMLKTAENFGIPCKEVADKYPLLTTSTYAEFIRLFRRDYGGKIPQAILDDAKRHKIPGYAKMSDLTPASIAREIQAGKVIIARHAVGDNTYKDARGAVSWLAKDLFPLRVPKVIESGHLWCINEYRGLNEYQKYYGPQSWGTRWAWDQEPEYMGYWNAVWKTQKPYFTEGWTINDIPEAIKEEIKDLPLPVVQVIKKSDSDEWKKWFLYYLRKFGVIS